LILSPWYYLVKCKSYEAPHYAVFSNLPPLHPPRSKYPPQDPFSDTLNLCSFHRVRYHISHQYKAVYKMYLKYCL
jgi:hypothetical protein